VLRGKRDQRTPLSTATGGRQLPTRIHQREVYHFIHQDHSCPSLEAVGSHRSSIERGVFGLARTAHVSC
jgi:hypothetical protein